MSLQDEIEHKKAIKRAYVENQLISAQPFPLKDDEFVRIQIYGKSGKTNWLNINKKQLAGIEEILVNG